MLAIVVGAVAALAVVMIVLGIAGSGREDPLRARLNQLGAMTAKDLQELELQQPFFDRTIRPIAGRLSASVARITSSSFSERTEKRLAMAGNPGDMRVSDWLGIKAIGAGVGGALFFLAFFIFLAAPTFFDPMFNKPPDVVGIPLGVVLLLVALFSMGMGFVFIRKIVDIEV